MCISFQSCDSFVNCYCPSVGPCENSLYTVKFNHLIKNNTNTGQHNRAYYFTVKVTNGARLVAIEHVDILADDSPPVRGVVVEGPEGYPDIDYTSEASVIVRWNGFIDHESGIMKYRIGIGEHCLTATEMNVYSHDLPKNLSLYESSEAYLKVNLPHDGLYYVSVLAYNNALEPSEVACSDGVFRDTTPTKVTDLTLESAKVKPVIGCYDNKVWHIFENLTAYKLQKTEQCNIACNSTMTMQLVQYLPKRYRYSNHSSYSTAMCTKLSRFSEDWFIYLPSDKIKLRWILKENESQIQKVYTGFGSTSSASMSPDLISYLETNNFNEYHIVHSGLDPGIPVYAFVQVKNKADLTTLVSFGPIIIDETPPLYRGNIAVIQEPKYIYVGWTENTFIEAEQKEPIDSVLFRIGR